MTGSTTLKVDPHLQLVTFDTNAGGTRFFEGGVRGGMRMVLRSKLTLQTGLAFFIGDKQDLSGNYYSLPGPPADLSYNYNVSMRRLMAETRLIYALSHRTSVFGGLGLGAAFTTLRALKFKSLNGTVPPDSSAENKTNLAYSASLGLDFSVTKALHITGGVSYLALGKANLALSFGGSPTLNIARWDPSGASWSSLGAGVTKAYYPRVSALAVTSGSLYVGEELTAAGGVGVANIAHWDTGVNAWSTLSVGVASSLTVPGVTALSTLGSNLYVDGGFVSAGGLSVKNAALWTGNAWSALDAGLPNAEVRSMVVAPSLLLSTVAVR